MFLQEEEDHKMDLNETLNLLHTRNVLILL